MTKHFTSLALCIFTLFCLTSCNEQKEKDAQAQAAETKLEAQRKLIDQSIDHMNDYAKAARAGDQTLMDALQKKMEDSEKKWAKAGINIANIYKIMTPEQKERHSEAMKNMLRAGLEDINNSQSPEQTPQQ